jgi:hypothetical protein
VLSIPADEDLFEWYVTTAATADQQPLVFPAGWADENETVTVVVI